MGGPRDSRIARSATDRSSHRGTSRGTAGVVNGGRREKTGVMTSHSRDTLPRGSNAAKTIRAMQVTATALRVLGIAPFIVTRVETGLRTRQTFATSRRDSDVRARTLRSTRCAGRSSRASSLKSIK